MCGGPMKRTPSTILQIHVSPFEKYHRAVETFSKCLCFLGTSISRSLPQSWRGLFIISTVEVGTVSEKPQAPAALSRTGEEHREGRPFSHFPSPASRIFLTGARKSFFSCLRKSYFGDGSAMTLAKVCVSEEGMTARWRRRATSLWPSVEDDYPRNQFGRQTLRRSLAPRHTTATPVARASAGSGRGLGRAG